MGNFSTRPTRPTGRSRVRPVALARLITVTGSQAAQTALLVDLFVTTGSPVWVSVAAFATVGVLGLVSPLAGALADRHDRRTVMILAEVAAGATYLCLLLPHSPAVTVILVLVGTALNAPVRAASAGLVPTLVPDADLTWANGLLSGSFSTGLLAGPVIGGALTASVGPHLVYGLNCATFVLSAVILATVLPPSSAVEIQRSPASASVFAAVDIQRSPSSASVFAGINHLLGCRRLRLLGLGSVFLFLAFGLTTVADLPLAAAFHTGAVGFSLLASCWGGGSIAGSLGCARWARPGQERAVATGGALAMAAALGSVAVLPSFPFVVVASAVGGIGSGMVFPPWTTLLQTLTPPALRGRVFAASDALEQTVNAIGILAAATVLATIGVRSTYLVIGLLAAVAGGCLYQASTTPRITTPRTTTPLHHTDPLTQEVS